MNAIGALSKANRQKYKLSQYEVEEKTQISRHRLSRIENGHGGAPTLNETAQLAKLYKDSRMLGATCNDCQIHHALLSIVSNDVPIGEFADFSMFSSLFASSISDSCSRIKENAQDVETDAALREKRILVIKEAKRIKFLADALVLLAEQMG